MAPKLPKQMRKRDSDRRNKLDQCDPLTLDEVVELWVSGGDPKMEWCSDDYEARKQQIKTMLLKAMVDGSIKYGTLPSENKDMDRAPKFLLKTKQPDRNRDG